MLGLRWITKLMALLLLQLLLTSLLLLLLMLLVLTSLLLLLLLLLLVLTSLLLVVVQSFLEGKEGMRWRPFVTPHLRQVLHKYHVLLLLIVPPGLLLRHLLKRCQLLL